MADKLCVFCDHLSLNCEVEYGYYEGDVYPSGNVHCLKKHWTLGTNKFAGGDPDYNYIRFNKGELADAIQTAKECPDYSPPSQRDAPE